MTRSKIYILIIYNKVDDRKLEPDISVHVDYVFLSGRPETLEKI